MSQQALTAAYNMLAIADRVAVRLGLDLQHMNDRALKTMHADETERRFVQIRDAVTSARGLIATGHEIEAFRHLSGALAS